MNENEQYELNGFSLAFKSPKVEGEFLQEVAQRRWPVLIWVFAFDVFCFSLRFVAKLTTSSDESDAGRPFEVVQEMGHQLANMAMLYVLIGLLNKRARTAGNNAARQEEVLLSICMGLAICNLLASLRTDNAQDYVYVSYFLICTSTFLKIRWWVGTGLLATPMVAVQLWYASPAPSALLPPDAVVHIVVAWAVGGLMAYLSDWYRRQMYANARLACAAHEKEMMEATARIQAQRELAAAQAQAAQRALTVAREKAAHEAKSEFMSLMCHEVRTPLNGCLASAEMLLETPLKEEQRELANTIRVSGSILLSTVSNFLDFFKLEAGKRLDIVRSEVMLGDLVGDVHCIIEAMIGRGGATALQQPQLIGVPQYVCCDPDRLRGILLNLYTNAAKFTKRGHIVLRVRSVLHDYTPPAPPGYSAILLQPSYHPSSSSHRSMDLSSCVLLSPATEPPVLQQQQQQRQQQLGKPAAAQQSEPPSSAPAQQAATAATDSGAASNTHLQQQQQQAADVDSHISKAAAGAVQPDHQQQQGQPFWQQASQWAMKVLPNGQVRMHSNRGAAAAAAAAGGAVGSAGVATSSSKADTGGSSSKGAVGQQQYDVHAMSSSSSNDGSAGKLAAAAAAAAGGDGAPAAAAAAGVAVSAGSNLPGSGRPGRSHTNTVGNTRNSSSNRDEACWLLFEVEDTGVGITRDGLATLFREYVQGTEDEMCKPRTRGGTGLGLSICSKQVGVLGGIIGAHSCKGQGSTFWFKIPTYSRPTSSSLSKQQQQHQQQQQQQHDTARHQQLRRSLDRRVSLDQHLLRQSLERQRVQDSQQQQQQSSMVRAGSSASSSNTGTYSVMHSGLYQSSSSTSSSNLTTPNEHNKQQQQQQLEGDRRQAGSAAAAATAATAAATLPAPGADSSCDSSSNGGAAAATSADASNKSSTQTAATPAAPKPPQHPGAAAAAAAGTPAAAATTAAPAGSSSTGGGGAAAAAVLPRQSLSFDGRAPPPLDTAKLAGRRVLLAEDNLINQTVARKMLSSLGMQVEVAMNGLEALNAVQRTAQHTTGTTNTTTSNSSSSSNTCGKEQPFSIVLMDMAMPVMGGVEATRKIRSQGFTLPIVAMTANASDKDRDECAAAGMNGFLSKPVLRDQLARALLATVEEYETQQQQQQQEGCNSGRS